MTGSCFGRRQFAAVFVVAAAMLSTKVSAVRHGHLAAPNLLRIEGYAGKAPADTRREAHLVMEYQGKDYDFDVIKMTVLTGNRSYLQVLQDVTPYRVNFIVRGTSAAVATLIGADAGQRLVITARNRAGSRDLLVDTVTIAVEPPATPR
jgi:hypothetical protein